MCAKKLPAKLLKAISIFQIFSKIPLKNLIIWIFL